MVHSIKISTLKNKAFYYAAYFYEKFKIARFELPGRQVGIFFYNIYLGSFADDEVNCVEVMKHVLLGNKPLLH